MAYATQADIVPARMTLGDLAELTTDADDPNPAQTMGIVVGGALNDASALVDSYCGQRYQTPMQASGLVKQMVIDLAIYNMASNRRDTKPNETWTQRRDQAMSYLRDVSVGKASLDQPSTAAAPQTSSADVTTPTRRQTFDDDHLRGFC